MSIGLREFTRRYLEMRAAQKRYFKTRTLGDLDVSKRLERDLDRTAEDIAEDAKHPLFPQESTSAEVATA